MTRSEYLVEHSSNSLAESRNRVIRAKRQWEKAVINAYIAGEVAEAYEKTLQAEKQRYEHLRRNYGNCNSVIVRN